MASISPTSKEIELPSNDECGGVSFAKAMSTPKKSSFLWPSLSPPSKNLSLSELSCLNSLNFEKDSRSEESYEEIQVEVKPKSHTISEYWNEEVQAQLDKKETRGGVGDKKKSKKKKNQVLFSSGMNYKGN